MKNIVIIGACGLIGRSIVRQLSVSNKIIAVDINEQDLKNLSSENDISYKVADINSESSILALIDFLKSNFDKVDAVVNLAYPRNKQFGKDFFDVKLDDFCENMNLHLGGYFNVTQKFCSFFKQQGGGSIVNFSSIYGVSAPKFDIYEGTKMTNGPEYAAIKSSLLFLTQFIAQRMKGTGVRINAVSPGGVADGQPESFLNNYKKYCNEKGMLDPDDLVGAVNFLISDESRYVNGQNIIVDDGFSL